MELSRLLADVELHEKRGEVRCRIELPDAPGWLAEGLFRLGAGDLALVAVQVYQWRPTIAEPTEVTAAMLRSVSVADLRAKARAGAAEWFDVAEEHGAEDLAAFAATVARPRRPGRAGQDERVFLPWAVRYVRKIADNSRSPVAELAAEHGEKRERVRDFIHECRRRGLLTAGAAGRASGSLTEKAIAMLNEETEGR